MTSPALTATPATPAKVRHPKILKGDSIWKFLTGGNATATIKNRDTGNRATYKVVSKDDGETYQVLVFTGNDNTRKAHYTLLGVMDADGTWTPWTELGRIDALVAAIAAGPKGHWVDSKPTFLGRARASVRNGRSLSSAQSYRLNGAMGKYRVAACPPSGMDRTKRVIFPWTWNRLMDGGVLPEAVEVWHEGSCCHCSKKLTVPASIELGKGWDCTSQRGEAEAWEKLNKKLGKDLVRYASTLQN